MSSALFSGVRPTRIARAIHINLVSKEDSGDSDYNHFGPRLLPDPLSIRGGERPCEPLLEVAAGIGLLTAASKEDVAPQVSEILGMVAELGQKLSDSMEAVINAEILEMVGQAVAHVAAHVRVEQASASDQVDGSKFQVEHEPTC